MAQPRLRFFEEGEIMEAAEKANIDVIANMMCRPVISVDEASGGSLVCLYSPQRPKVVMAHNWYQNALWWERRVRHHRLKGGPWPPRPPRW